MDSTLTRKTSDWYFCNQSRNRRNVGCDVPKWLFSVQAVVKLFSDVNVYHHSAS